MCITPFKSLKVLAKACLACFRGKQMTPNHLWKSSKITKAVYKKRYLHHMIWQILFISLSLCLHGCLNTSPHLSSVTRLRKVVLDTCVTLQALTIISYDNKDIKRVHVRTTMMTCVLFVPVLMQHKEFLQWPVLLTVQLQENNQPLKINVRAGSNEQK